MLIDLTETERKELIDFYKRKAVKNLDFNVVARCVHTVEKLTKKEEHQPINMATLRINEKEAAKHIIREKFTDIPLTFNYPNSRKIEYKIKKMDKEGHIYSKYKKLKLSIPQILNLKNIIKQGDIFQSQNDWDTMGKNFGVKGGSLQTYSYNIEIGTFDKWIKKYLERRERQTTLKNTTTCGVKS